jgi:hypothetical protein
MPSPRPRPGEEPLDEPHQPQEAHDPYGDMPSRPPEQRSAFWRSPRTRVVAAAAVVVLAVGAFFGVKAMAGGGSSTSAATQGAGNGAGRGNPGGRGTAGTLQSVDGSTLTVAIFNRGANGNNAGGGTTTVITNGSTKFYKTVTGSFSDVKAGDRVTATGTPDGTNSLTAARITDTGTMMGAFGGAGGGPGGGGGRFGGNGTENGNGAAPPSSLPNGAARPDPNSFANGTVKSISGTTLTVTQQDGTTKTVNTNGSTVVSVLKAVSINDLTTGQPITVRGTPNSDGTVTASNVVQGLGGFGRGSRDRQAPGPGTTTQ